MRSLKVKNFGKIDEAEIDIGNFTVLAGANNTGKSFVLKLLYSLLSPMNVQSTLDGQRSRADSLKSAAWHSPRRRDSSTGMIDRKAYEMETIFASVSEDGADEWKFVQAELKDRVEMNLVRNFQVSRVYELKGDPGEDLEANVDDLLRMIVSEKSFELDVGWSAFAAFDGIVNAVYLESPIYWKLAAALRDARASRGDTRELLTGIPEYFYDLVDSLAFEYSGEMAYPEVYGSLVGSDVLNGRISISKLGEMSFRENGSNRPLRMTSAGAANVGVLALLIERKVVDRGTMLFVDQPEAHLHPSWQVVMAEALFDLARNGVRVVVATHGLDILKWLEVRIEKHPEDERLVALNRFPNPARTEDGFKLKIAKIKQELSKPFADLYLEGV